MLIGGRAYCTNDERRMAKKCFYLNDQKESRSFGNVPLKQELEDPESLAYRATLFLYRVIDVVVLVEEDCFGRMRPREGSMLDPICFDHSVHS